jgi:hypothetical protein
MKINNICHLFLANWSDPLCGVLLEKPTIAQWLKKFPAILWNPKFHSHVYKSHALVLIFIHINSVHSTQLFFCKSPFNNLHVHLCHPSGLFPSTFPVYTVLFSCACSVSSPSHPRIDHSNIWWRTHFAKPLIM